MCDAASQCEQQLACDPLNVTVIVVSMLSSTIHFCHPAHTGAIGAYRTPCSISIEGSCNKAICHPEVVSSSIAS
jgi:hypothetical protein